MLGTKLLGFRCVGYVEWEPYCQAVLSQRIADGHLDEAPIFGDVREFVQSGAASQYLGVADVVSAGFPCQPHSVAGRRLAGDDERNLWPATRDVICAVAPAYVLLENVAGLLSSGYFGVVLGDLADLGLDAEWGVFRASREGAGHQRERLFIVASDPDRSRLERGEQWAKGRLQPLDNLAARKRFPQSLHDLPEPRVLGVGNGFPNRVDRTRAIGNAQVPAVVVRAWTELTK